MSSAKRTPRYVDVIRPFDVVEGGHSSHVIPLRPEMPSPSLPAVTEAWPRLQAVPVARRPWQLLLVPPTPGTPTRSFNVARWQARLMAGLALTVLVIASAGVVALVVAIRAPDLFATSAEAHVLRARLALVEDSLAMARIGFDEPTDSAAGAMLPVSTPPKGAVASRAPFRAAVAVAPHAPKLSLVPGRADVSRPDIATTLARISVEDLPVIGPIASRFSRSRFHPLLHIRRPHLGVDVAARRGTPITVPAAGRVSFVGRKFGFGLVVEVEHVNGITTRYGHCASALVSVGTQVHKGMPIATVGSSGLATGPHLHYEVLVGGHQVDPLRFRMPQTGDGASVQTATTPASSSAAQLPALVAAPAATSAAESAPGGGSGDTPK